jgi:uncharacterized protein YqhQ
MFAIQDIIGGRAHLKGVSFYSEDYSSTSTINNSTIQHSLRKREKKKSIPIFDVLERIPFVRGIVIFLESLYLAGKPVRLLLLANLLMWCITNFTAHLSNSRRLPVSELLSKLHISMYVPVGIIFSAIILALLLIRFSSIGQYHGAEHKAFNAHKEGKELTLENVRAASRVSCQCGTNLMVFALTVAIVLFPFIPSYLATLLSLSIGYEIFRLDNQTKIVKPFHAIGAFVQQYIVTAEPTDEQIEVAILSLKNLIEAD